LALDPSEEIDSLKVNFPVRRKNEQTGEIETDLTEIDFDSMRFTCALDVAEMAADLSLEEFAESIGLSYDRCFQVIDEAKKRFHEVAVEMGAAEGIAVRPTIRKKQPAAEANDNSQENPDE
jgi:hypothetical protein